MYKVSPKLDLHRKTLWLWKVIPAQGSILTGFFILTLSQFGATGFQSQALTHYSQRVQPKARNSWGTAQRVIGHILSTGISQHWHTHLLSISNSSSHLQWGPCFFLFSSPSVSWNVKEGCSCPTNSFHKNFPEFILYNWQSHVFSLSISVNQSRRLTRTKEQSNKSHENTHFILNKNGSVTTWQIIFMNT